MQSITIILEHSTLVNEESKSRPSPPEAVIREAQRRQRRRRSVWLALTLALIVLCLGLALVLVPSHPHNANTKQERGPTRPSPGSPSPSVSLANPQALAVAPNGNLYVADAGRDQILRRLPSGQFQIVAGNGKAGFTGDHGPAVDAEINDPTGIVVAPDGTLYIADSGNGRVRAVSPEGTISTVVGGGGDADAVVKGDSAYAVSLTPISVAVGPTGNLFLTTSQQILELMPDASLQPIVSVANAPYGGGPLNEFDQIAVDGQGNIIVSSAYRGWTIYEITPNGMTTYLGVDRRYGGAPATVGTGPHGIAEVADGNSVMAVEGTNLVTTHAFARVPGTDLFTLQYFATGSDGTVYADDLGPGAGYQRMQQLVEVKNDHTTILWQHRNF
jgi:NHL repeat